ncbi:O-antigen ligase family protein [Alteribacillus sp. JSM 102045]|uniref:O-antigen ligase family protein n=1 Tax=Alteribacillus sp. JSM 102045 TaxID=1562101 RepID=UPI0035C0817B
MVSIGYKLEDSRFRIKKSNLEWIGISLLLLFSFVSSTTLLISLFFLLFLLLQKEIGAIKILNIITLRTIINPVIAVNIGTFQSVKWIIIMGCSIYLIFSFLKMRIKDSDKIRNILLLLIVFTGYNTITSLLFSSLPVVSIFKLLSYAIVFAAILIGIGYTYDKINWIKWMLNLLKLVIIPSVIFISLSFSFETNGYSFQGITNQPNVFGIISVLFVAISLVWLKLNKSKYIKIYTFSIIIMTITLVVLSQSRTAFISILLIIFTYIFFSDINKKLKFTILPFFFSVLISLTFNNKIISFFNDFLSKGQTVDNLLFSRSNQINGLLTNINNSPWFGNGFAVPVLPFRTFEFSYDYIVEPGNIILAILSYSGIIGFVIFILYIIKILLISKSYFMYFSYLPMAAILISMGEMVFFSTNNIGIWCYMFLAIYIFGGQIKRKHL